MGELEKKKPDALDKIDKETFDNLTSKQIKYVKMQVSTNLDRNQIAKNLGVSKNMLTRWDKDPHVDRFRAQFKEYIFKDEAEQLRMQKKILKDRVFAETMRRFDDPPEINDDMDLNEIKDIKKQYAAYASFSDILKAAKTIDTLYGDEGMNQSEDTFVEDIRHRFLKRKTKRSSFRNALDKAGEGGEKTYKELVTENGIDYYEKEQDDPTVETESVEEVEEVYEEISILRRDKDE